MRHRRRPPAERAALLAFRAARLALVLSTVPLLLALAVYLCVAGDPAR
ncbi:hypothetical protein TPA0910_30570 [Streptomyces hygroscopicus subsp. sporocinereus]|uniref:ABC transporter permease n=1 Tax=Streptomyces hygroscopicus TaxID=1912 RepID=A0ABQ3TZ12_STRHY|nr:hypothetical protein [Streptomyces hygroscopicus]GHJ28624.1 hypothetical protein TPA0910_30570 [Streptomyces hygroscopicus]